MTCLSLQFIRISSTEIGTYRARLRQLVTKFKNLVCFHHSRLVHASTLRQPMSKMTDTLVEINRNDLPILQNLFRITGSKGCVGCMTIGNYIGFFKQDPTVKHVNVYCLNGDFNDGTFVITVSIFTSQLMFRMLHTIY